MFGREVKVAIEIARLATDAGLIDPDTKIIAIAGTGRGADTALVIGPSHTYDAFPLRVKEIICKPRF